MALVTIFGLAALWLAFRRKEWLLAVICVIFGLMLASTGTDFGDTALKILTDVSKTIDGLFTKG
jgi:TctA family transporter